MKTLALQDNLSKTKAVEDIYQQALRYPDEVQQSLAGQLQRIYRRRKRSVVKSKSSEDSKLRPDRKSDRTQEPVSRGQIENPPEPEEDSEQHSCIDLQA